MHLPFKESQPDLLLKDDGLFKGKDYDLLYIAARQNLLGIFEYSTSEI